jgi:hypothetical protein
MRANNSTNYRQMQLWASVVAIWVYVTLANGDARDPSGILELLKETGFQEVKIAVSRHIPGTKKYPKVANSAPRVVSENLTHDELSDSKKRLDGVLSGLNVNEFASFDTFSAKKLV